MSFYERFEAETADARERLLVEPVLARLLSGNISQEGYAWIIREIYHLSRHTSRFISAGASRIEDSKDRIRTRFLHHAVEEDGHHKFAQKDLKTLGYPDAFLDERPPLSGTTAIVSYHYMLAHIGNPIGIMGAVVVFEGLARDFAGQAADETKSGLGLPNKALTFLTTHSKFDIEHMDEAIQVLDHEIDDLRDQEEIIRVGRQMYDFYRWNFVEIGELVEEERAALVAG